MFSLWIANVIVCLSSWTDLLFTYLARQTMEVFPFRGVRLTSGLTCGFRVAYDDRVTLLLDREIQDFITIPFTISSDLSFM